MSNHPVTDDMRDAEAVGAVAEGGGAVNEFEQPVEGVSLTTDAWRRLKKNRMAMFGLGVVVLYAVLSLTAPILPIHSFRYQVSEHRDLPPSFTRSAGDLWLERVETRSRLLAERDGRTDLNDEELADLATIRRASFYRDRGDRWTRGHGSPATVPLGDRPSGARSFE